MLTVLPTVCCCCCCCCLLLACWRIDGAARDNNKIQNEYVTQDGMDKWNNKPTCAVDDDDDEVDQ
jgi:hypothetical protein